MATLLFADFKYCLSIVAFWPKLRSKWIPDKSIAEVMLISFPTKVKDINTTQVNKYMRQLIECSNTITSVIDRLMVMTVLCNTHHLMSASHKSIKEYFYYFSDPRSSKPPPKDQHINWKQIYHFTDITSSVVAKDILQHSNNYNISEVTVKKRHREIVSPVTLQFTPTPKKRVPSNTSSNLKQYQCLIAKPTSEEHERAKSQVCSFWESQEMKRLFGSKWGSADITLIKMVDIIDDALGDPTTMSRTVTHATNNPMTPNQRLLITKQLYVLRCSYVKALEMMETEMNWNEVLTKTIVLLEVMGLSHYTNPRSIARLHRYFRVDHLLPHPNKSVVSGKRLSPKIFRSYPHAKNAIAQWCSLNLSSLSAESLATHINLVIIPQLYDLHVNESKISHTQYQTKTSFLKQLNLDTVSISTAWRWMRFLGFKYKEQRKCYYSDKHEDVENVQARKVFIETYLRFELRAHNWVQISDRGAKRLEKEFNLLSAYYPYKQEDGQSFREYHIDTHPCLLQYVKAKDMGGDLSVRRNQNERPIILLGQDESVFK